VELDTEPGTLVIVGPNGAGKTSLLLLLLGALRVERGRIEVGSSVLLDTERRIDVPLELRRFGYVPQDYALFPHLTVRGNLDFAMDSAFRRLDPSERADRVHSLLSELDLADLAGRLPYALSGGERQRVALARALAAGPRALLLDEPLAALDVGSRAEVREFLAEHLRAVDVPTIVVTHDATDAKLLGRNVAVLEAGTITQRGTFEELGARPATRFIEAWTGAASG
ncbi:MAG: ATP-binding cassette domain-containing protein, partial [Sandaracinaceae bacterium]|nr:ATP-binding cassette domain-containing protein [Sandaracinaceae bacterium]